jgi:hypothetical protein
MRLGAFLFFGFALVLWNPSLVLADTVDYLKDIKPILAAKCYACHGALQQKNGLRVDTVQFLLEGGNKGPAVVAGQSDKSLLIDHVTGANKARRMPPPSEGEPLAEKHIALLKIWIDEGAKGPADEKPETDPRDHWAFRTPVRPPVPKVKLAGWGQNPIDAFIAAELEKKDLQPQKPADKRLLLRRVYLDLIGLPPTLQEQEAFLKDTSADAYEKVVDRLLASPQYGERWGRHWMDIWRYSDWWGLGQEVRNSQKHIWHWRDWIIESLNADKGYDQMVKEMLAADELYPNDLDKLRGTGFLVRHYFKFNRTTWLDETIEHTSKAFLGLTMNCTKCHDHKFDPISHADYYRFRAFFEPYQVRMDQVPGETDYEKDGLPRVFDCNLDAPTYLHIRGDDRNPAKEKPLTPGLPKVLTWSKLDIQPVTLPPQAHTPGLRPHVLENQTRLAQQQRETAQKAVEQAKKAVADAEKTKPATPEEIKKGPPQVKVAPAEGKLLWQDDFARVNPDLWETKGGQWQFENGKLQQTFEGPMRGILKARSPGPMDFDARFKFTITGGVPFRSVGLSFDATKDSEALVYVTAQTSGPRLQVSYQKQGKSYFPSEASVKWPVELNQPIEMRVRVRDKMVHVAINGQDVVANALPEPRQQGDLQLVTFAATATFQEFALFTLPDTVVLAGPAGKKVPATPAKSLFLKDAKAALKTAEKALAVAEIQLEAVQARAAADQAKYQTPPAANFPALARQAAKLEKQANLAKAEIDLAQAEMVLGQKDTPKKAEAEKKRALAQAALDKARKAMESPGDSYTSLRGAWKTLESNLETEESRNRPFPTISTGRRTALAQWLTDPQHPLTARVAVNHLWGRHFGRPLVTTVFDFGRKGAVPSHPELLDYLAIELREKNWSMKHLHRLMVTSNLYRLSSSNADAPDNLEKDPENRLFWRMNPLRMEAQVVRDSLLHLAGELNLQMGGPSVPVNQDSNRRSLYFVHSHNDHNKFLSMFDDASVRECYRRSESIVPQQALTLSNSKLALAMAQKITDRLQQQQPKISDEEFIRTAFELILASPPTKEEQSECLEALQELLRLTPNQANAQTRARANLLHALLNHNDFITVR